MQTFLKKVHKTINSFIFGTDKGPIKIYVGLAYKKRNYIQEKPTMPCCP